VELLGKSFVLKVHFSTEQKPSFTAEQNGCTVNFSVMYTMKVPVYKIQSCLTIFVAEVMIHSCLIWRQYALVLFVFHTCCSKHFYAFVNYFLSLHDTFCGSCVLHYVLSCKRYSQGIEICFKLILHGPYTYKHARHLNILYGVTHTVTLD
jgi:hypothetical protein